MALMERMFPVTRWHTNYFDNVFAGIAREMQQAMDDDIRRMRMNMFRLSPCEPFPAIEGIKEAPTLQVKHPIVEEKGQTKLQLRYDVSQFRPEEVNVKVLGNNILQVSAHHREESNTGMTQRMYSCQYQLPSTVKVERLWPNLSDDGVLTVEAPAEPLGPKERMIPIEYKKK